MLQRIKEFFSFDGRTTRLEFLAVVMAVAVMTVAVIRIFPGQTSLHLYVFCLDAVLLVPAMVRRLHDIGRGGGYLVMVFFSGTLAILWLLLMPPIYGPNSYGPDPRDGRVFQNDPPDEGVSESGVTVREAVKARTGAVWIDHSEAAAARGNAPEPARQGKGRWPQFGQAKKQPEQQNTAFAGQLASPPSARNTDIRQSSPQTRETVVMAGKSRNKDNKSKDLIFG